MFSLSNLEKRISHKDKKTRVGRGIGSGHGGHTSTRGQKGQKARTGGKVPLYFEGGQLPLVKRLPHVKGFNNLFKKKFEIVKTSLLNNLDESTVSPKDLLNKGYIRNIPAAGVKVLFDETVKKPVKLQGFSYSKSAKSSIEKAGGTAA